jgi:BirA family biotin operon repressor/biotin-[acetyl-CoA-carboxylase] ligase
VSGADDAARPPTTSDVAVALDAFDGVPVAALPERIGATTVHAFARVSSTMDVAHALAAAGAVAGTLVLADAQTSGRGRVGRRWVSPAGTGLWFTLIERPTDASALAVLSLRLGLHAAIALGPFAPTPVRLKWPNDLYVGRGKLAGVLVEARWREARPEWVAVGFGLNVHPAGAPLEGAALGAQLSRVAVLAAVVPALRAAAALAGPLTPQECSAYAARDLAAGRQVVEPERGTVLGVSSDGSLRVAAPDGREIAVRHGSLRFADD